MIPIYDFIPIPYDDKYLEYNLVFHRYVITLDYLPLAIGDDEIINKLGGNDNAKWILDHISSVAYNVFDSYTDPKYRDKIRYYFSHSKYIRNWLIQVLKDVLIYSEADGGLYTAYATGINFNEMKAFDMVLNNYVGAMARQMMDNSGVGQRLLKFDLDRMTSQFATFHDLLVYMGHKGYIDIDKYYDRVIIQSNGDGFDYQEIKDRLDRYVTIQTPIKFDDGSGEEELYYLTEVEQNHDITFYFENSQKIKLNDDNTVEAVNIAQTEFYIDFLPIYGMPLVPKSNKYQITPNGNTGYILYEFGYWQTVLKEKGSNW